MLEKRNILNIAAKILAMAVSFIVMTAITRIVVGHVGNEQYGFYSLSNDFVNYALIASMALNSMANRYITLSYYEKKKDAVNLFFNSIFISNVMLSALLLVPSLFAICKLEYIINIPEDIVYDVKTLFVLMFINFFVSIIFSVFSAATFIHNRVDLDSVRSIESYGIRLLVVAMGFFVLKGKIWYVGLACLCSTCYVAAVNVYYVKKLTPEITFIRADLFRLRYVTELIKSGIWNCLTRVGAILLNGMDLLIANLFLSPGAMGILSISKTIPKMIISAIPAFATTFTPGITIAFAQNDRHQFQRKLITSIELCTLVSTLIQTSVIVLGKELYQLWLPGENAERLYVLSLVAMIGYLVLMPLENLYNVFTITNKIRISSVYMIAEAMVSFGIVMGLISVTEDEYIKLLVIAGVSSVVEIVRAVIFLPLYSARCLGVGYTTFYKPIVKIILLNFMAVAAGGAVMSVFDLHGWVFLLVKVLIQAMITFLLWWLLMLSGEERRAVQKKIKEIV